MCVIAETATITAATALAANLAIATTAASVGIAAVQMQQQRSAMQAQMNMQAQQAQRQQQMNRQQMILQQQQQRDAQILQASQQQQAMIMQQDQQRRAMVLNQRQQQDQYNLSVQQSNVQIANNYQRQLEQVKLERDQIARRNEAQRQSYQRGKESEEKQVKYNNEAANRMYVQQQSKMSEARKKAAFAQQAALAKSIGARGAILSAGRTGQSVGLLLNDVERQAGFEKAQATATMESLTEQSMISMDQAYLQALGANQRAADRTGAAPADMYLPSYPDAPMFVDPYGANV